jgi:hypothetical protein
METAELGPVPQVGGVVEAARASGPWWRDRSSAAWRARVANRLDVVDEDLTRVPLESRGSGEYLNVEWAGREARDLLAPSTGRGERLTLWLSGARIERAWAAVRRAEGTLLLILPEPMVRSRIREIEALVEAQFASRDSQRKESLDELKNVRDSRELTMLMRETLRAIRAQAQFHADLRMQEVRRFRNLLLASATALMLLLLTLAIVHALNPHFVSVCASSSVPPVKDLCPDGTVHSRRTDLFQVEFVGAIAGLLAALVALARSSHTPSPYSIPSAQVMFKAAAGAATALVGVLLLQGGALVGLSKQPGSSVLAYAALFGFAQQILTRLVDEKAGALAPAKASHAGGSTTAP